MKKKIFVTGGHFAPAKAVIQELLRRGSWEIYYIGRKYSMEGRNELALEYTEIPTLPGVHYLTINTGRIQRQFFVNFFQSVVSLLKIFIGLAQSAYYVINYEPNVIMSFGGYVAVPVVVWAWIFGIPIITHEQTTVSGRANQFVAFFAKKILVSWPQSLSHFPKGKVVFTGNPLREEVLKAESGKRKAESRSKLVIYITGGSQGAKAIDEVVAQILPELDKKYEVISGKLSGVESAKAMAQADLVVSRAGANTVTEILFFGKPAILIPLPNTHGDEQMKNGQMITATGLGDIIPQLNLTPILLLQSISRIMSNRKKYLAGAQNAKLLIRLDAAARIVDQLEEIK